MTSFDRSGHFRTNAYGTTFWVKKHGVRRDDWYRSGVSWALGSPQYKATDFLRRCHVGRGAKGCFVIPNARCPVCNVPVFYYQNSFGSKVYFDDLGPPWPKHPCTDRPPAGYKVVHPEWKPIILRKKGEIQEIIESANILGLLNQKQLGQLQRDEWTLLVVEDVVRTDDLNKVQASLVDTREAKSINFTHYSEQQLLMEGDLVTKNGNEFSFFDRTHMENVNFKDGGWVKPKIFAGAEPVQKNMTQQSIKPTTKKHFSIIDPYQFKRPKMSSFEMAHFPNNVSYFRSFIEKFRPIIENYIASGVRKPEDFAARLNGKSLKTFQKGKWTPRLAQYLLACMFEHDAKTIEKMPNRAKEALPTKPELKSSVEDFFGPGVSYETLVKRCIPMIKRMRIRGIVKNQDIADRLNKETLFGSTQYNWTAYAVELLIDLHQNGIRTDKDVSKILNKEISQIQFPNLSQHLQSSSMLSRDEIARLLSVLGRVSIKS